MLDELIVANLGIIAEAHLEPGPGFVVVTGETGAGKTMLLGALRLLMGAASRRELVGPFAGEAVVDGRFVVDGEEEVTLRRRVTGEGRSKAYVDGSMVPAKALQERMSGRVEVVGQHDHMLLTTAHGARTLVDGALGPAGRRAMTAYTAAWDDLVVIRQKLELLGGGRRELERELEMVQFQADDIAAAGFAEGDDITLAARADRLRHAEDLAAGFDAVLGALGDDGAMGNLASALGELSRMSRLDGELLDASERLEAVSVSLAELHLDLAAVAADLDHEPGELDAIEERIQRLGDLRRKYGDDLDEVLAFAEKAGARAAELGALLGTADDLARELESAADRAVAAAADLTKQRQRAAKQVAKDAVGHLQELGMTDPVVELRLAESELGPTGGDRIELAFASDSGLTPGPAGKIASGGELSRLTLALRLAAGIGDASLLAFDEVDAGIGGATALAMGEKLAALGRGRQLFCVTHLPQVAAHADAHFVVEREEAQAVVRRVDGDDRLTELSRMLGGLPDSERGQLHAAELLDAARNR
ncbi:MAG: AAA family ATPase [Acidimicrobiia bacterium]|nr:AAA family ATPase [Acidimicrobiia bacterium]